MGTKAPAPPISIHAPTRGATYLPVTVSGGNAISIHAPTRGATRNILHIVNSKEFQSTLPRGERPGARTLDTLIKNFNPRSHEGSDFVGQLFVYLKYCISIHAPTRGATRPPAMALTKSLNFNPRSHEGSD